jgi:hypothetical protein
MESKRTWIDILGAVINSIIVVMIIVVVVNFVSVSQSFSKQPESARSIYITRTDHVLTLEGETVWILEYTVDGRFEAPAFTSREAMTRYREYLDTIGTVYRRDSEVKQ